MTRENEKEKHSKYEEFTEEEILFTIYSAFLFKGASRKKRNKSDN
jgi:hypothetical protein